ncbi:MAG: hypothetical protein C4348_01605 [Patescibacteria group bacterium]
MKGQLILEVVLLLGLITLILGIFSSILILIFNSLRYSNINQGAALAGFEKYRNVLLEISRSNWSYLDSLSTSTDYYLTSTPNGWQISIGKEENLIGSESYFFSFRINNFLGNPEVKLISVNSEALNQVFSDYFLLPKLNVNF